MSFASAWNLRQLPEKPWETGAVARLVVAVFTSMIMLGSLAALIIRHFETPQKTSVILFLGCAAAALIGAAAALVMLSRPWRNEERLLFHLIVLLTCIYGGMLFIWLGGKLTAGAFEPQNSLATMLIAVVAFQGTALVLVHLFLREHVVGWRESFGLDQHPGRALIAGACVGALVTYPILWLNGASFHLFEKLALHPQEQHTVQMLRQTQGWLSHFAAGLATIIIAPVGEEVLFRGILYPWAKRKYSQPIAMWGTAILFGAIHLNLSSGFPLILLAVILICIYEYTGNLLAPIAVHAVFNAANFVALFLQQN